MIKFSLLHTLTHPNAVYAVAYSPNGQRLATASLDNSIKLWDAATGKELARLRGHGDGVCGVAFSADGKRLISASLDKTVRFWDATNGSLESSHDGHANYIECMGVSADRRWLATGGHDKQVRVIDCNSGSVRAVLVGHTEPVYSVALSADGRWVASGATDDTLRLWEVETGKQQTIPGHDGVAQSLVFRNAAPILISGSSHGVLEWWTVPDGARIHFQELRSVVPSSGITNTSSGLVKSLTVSHDDALLASGGSDGRIHLWNADRATELVELMAHRNAVYGLAFSPDGKQLASASFDRTIKVWELSDAP